jgi:hypothetical protein
MHVRMHVFVYTDTPTALAADVSRVVVRYSSHITHDKEQQAEASSASTSALPTIFIPPLLGHPHSIFV